MDGHWKLDHNYSTEPLAFFFGSVELTRGPVVPRTLARDLVFEKRPIIKIKIKLTLKIPTLLH